MFRAKLASPSALAWQKSTTQAVTFSVFDRSCTIINKEGMLLSVVLPEIGPGPFSAVIDNESGSHPLGMSLFSAVQVGAPVNVNESRIDIDGILIDTKDVKTWEPQPDWDSIDRWKFREQSLELRKNLLLYGTPGSLSIILTKASLDGAQSHLVKSWGKVSEGLHRLELGDCRGDISRIAGLGVGLTPAGDDFLVGVLMAIWSVTPRTTAKILAKDITSAVEGRTTLLSEAYMKAAGCGEASYAWHELINAIAAGNRRQIQEATSLLMRSGSTSGSDALTGFVLAGDLLANNR